MPKNLDHRSVLVGAVLGSLAALPAGFGVSRVVWPQEAPPSQVWFDYVELPKGDSGLDRVLRDTGRDIVHQNYTRKDRQLTLFVQLLDRGPIAQTQKGR